MCDHVEQQLDIAEDVRRGPPVDPVVAEPVEAYGLDLEAAKPHKWGLGGINVWIGVGLSSTLLVSWVPQNKALALLVTTRQVLEGRCPVGLYRRYLGAMSVSDGLVAETKHSLRDALKTMPRLLNRTAGRPCALTLRLEDFEAGWEAAVSRLFDLIGVTDPRTLRALTSLVARHNVYARSRGKASAAGGAPYNRHVSGNASAKDELRAQLVASGAAFERIQRVRAVLGYPAVGKEGRGRARAHVARRPTA